jgi:DtxR family transcriptional regulator, Mn-dependent transcriptional regulator
LGHAISDKVLERIDTLLGHPSVDPHGDPIPSAQGQVATGQHSSLADSPAGRPLRVARVIDQDPGFLQFVERCGLLPGTAVTVEARNPQADSVSVHPQDRRTVTLGTAAAGKILVEDA